MFVRPREPVCQSRINTAQSVINTAAPMPRINSSRASRLRATATRDFSVWAATASHSETSHMTTNPKGNTSKAPLTIRFHLTDGSVHSFVQTDLTAARTLWDAVEPAKLFARPRIVVGSEHSKAVFVSAEIIRVDFIHDSFQCWEFPGGYSDIVELSEEEFRKHAHLDEPGLMIKREQPTPVGDLLVSFVKLQMRGSPPLFVMVEIPVKLPAESQSFMHFMLSKASVHMRLRGGGIGVLNLANLAGYTVYPGVAQIPADSWLAEPAPNAPKK
jgi:hypothetical protein